MWQYTALIFKMTDFHINKNNYSTAKKPISSYLNNKLIEKPDVILFNERQHKKKSPYNRHISWKNPFNCAMWTPCVITGKNVSIVLITKNWCTGHSTMTQAICKIKITPIEIIIFFVICEFSDSLCVCAWVYVHFVLHQTKQDNKMYVDDNTASRQ